MINDYLDRDKLYWIGLNDISKEGKEYEFMNFDINCLEGRYVWSESQKETQYQIWWDRVFSIGREPNGNGDCVFKDGYKEPDGKWGWNQFGWADFPCDADFWSKQAICGNLVPLVLGAPPDFRGNAPGIRGRFCLILRFKL